MATTMQMLINDHKHAILVCEVLADIASNGKYKWKTAYSVLRSLSPVELFEIYSVCMDRGNESFREEFGSLYHAKQGDSLGPLFQEVI